MFDKHYPVHVVRETGPAVVNVTHKEAPVAENTRILKSLVDEAKTTVLANFTIDGGIVAGAVHIYLDNMNDVLAVKTEINGRPILVEIANYTLSNKSKDDRIRELHRALSDEIAEIVVMELMKTGCSL